MDAAVVGAIFAGVVGILSAFFAFIKWVITKLTSSLDKNTQAMQSVATATTKSAKEAKQRNGHLAELAIENKKSNDDNQKAILDAISNLSVQSVEKQQIKEQVIEHSTVKD